MTPFRARIMLVITVAGWGVTFIANHELLESLDPMQIVTLRFVAVSAAFGLFFVLVPSRRPHLRAREWRLLVLGGLLAVPGAQILAVAGQQYLSPAMTGLVVSCSPAIAAVLAHRFLRERLAPRQVTGIVVAMVGVSIVILFASGTGTTLTVDNPAGATLVVLSQVCWAAYTVLGRRLAVRHDPLTMVATTFLLGSVALVPLLPHAIDGVSQVTTAQWWWMAHLVVGGTLIPHVAWFVALRYLPANETAMTMYLVPLYATIFSVWILDERLTMVGVLGGVAILVGVALSRRPGVRPARPSGDTAPDDVDVTATTAMTGRQ